MSDYESNGNNVDDERVLEWEMGLPNGDDLTPLSQLLIPSELASAFSISPLPHRTVLDVNRASQDTLSSIRGGHGHALSSSNNNIKSYTEIRDPTVIEMDETDQNGSGSDARKLRKPDSPEEADSAMRNDDDPSARTVKRPRLVWTPQLHKRFVDVVAHLGIKNAVPKTIMQLMNVEGLTRENVASHLQKYRLYLKRMQGFPNDDPSSSADQLFASTPVPPQCLQYETGVGNSGTHANSNNSNNYNYGNNSSTNSNNNNNNNTNNSNGHLGVPFPVPYGSQPGMMAMPMYGMNQGFHQGHGGFDPSMYNMNMGMNMSMHNMMQQRDWSMNKHGSMMSSYPHQVAPPPGEK